MSIIIETKWVYGLVFDVSGCICCGVLFDIKPCNGSDVLTSYSNRQQALYDRYDIFMRLRILFLTY